jgi:hypothetical protein
MQFTIQHRAGFPTEPEDVARSLSRSLAVSSLLWLCLAEKGTIVISASVR